MFNAVILPLAKQDIREAALWYNGKQNGLGKKFTFQVRQKISFLRKQPLSMAVRYDEVRTAVLDIYPYMIHYIVDESKQQIIISAVLHTSRNSDLWADRIF